MNSEDTDQIKHLEQDEKIIKLIRIIARGIGPILFLIMLVFAVGQGGIDRLISLTGIESLVFVGILTMFFGIIWAYQNEIAGGILIVIVYIVLAIIQGSFIPNAIFPIFLITGILHIYVGVMEIGIKKRQKTEDRRQKAEGRSK